MILTTQEQWVDLYNAIRNDSCSSDERHVFIYASSKEADSVAALRILEVGQGEELDAWPDLKAAT